MNEQSPVKTNDHPFDAFLLVSFGGPEGPQDVLPFLENVLRGKNVPRERFLEVAAHYEQFGGVSPINEQNRQLLRSLEQEFAKENIAIPIYWGNRNWHPLLVDTIRQMKADGVRRALAFVTSIFSSYSGCRQYLEDIQRAREEVGPDSPVVEKLRSPFNHPGFIEAVADNVHRTISQLEPSRRPSARLIFTAHSIPVAMARGSAYVAQLNESCRLVSEALGGLPWELVYQSRSGPPRQPWLEPDICDRLRQLADQPDRPTAVVVPIGFVSDHMEVVYDLDTETRAVCEELGIAMVRAPTVGTHPRFVAMIRELVQERLAGTQPRAVVGTMPPWPDQCPPDCCPSGRPPQVGK